MIGEPARALMLSALMDGRARTATELAGEAAITRQTASAHLAKLTEQGLLALEKQGRHRYYRLRGTDVASALETLMVLGTRRRPTGATHPASPERQARTCYDHLAGRLGVALFDALCAKGYLAIGESQVALSPSGEALFSDLGIDVERHKQGRRSFARLCLDWSERRNHLAGALGRALLDYFLANDWIRRLPGSRALALTPRGRAELTRVFDIRPGD